MGKKQKKKKKKKKKEKKKEVGCVFSTRLVVKWKCSSLAGCGTFSPSAAALFVCLVFPALSSLHSLRPSLLRSFVGSLNRAVLPRTMIEEEDEEEEDGNAHSIFFALPTLTLSHRHTHLA